MLYIKLMKKIILRLNHGRCYNRGDTMIYLDYSATTPVRKEVLDSFVAVAQEKIGNPNSLHRLGVEAKQLELQATKQIADILGCKPNEIIYTSGATESNNMVVKGVALQYQNRGKHIITTHLEHSSVYGPMDYLQKKGFTIDYVKTDTFGRVDLEHLKQLLREDTILVSIASVNSETGLRQPVEEIGKLLQQYPKCFFHVDMTQSIGKIFISLEKIDFVSFSAHKFYGMKGIGCLIKKEHISLEPLIHGGKSTTPFRAGTPALPLIVSTAKALRLITEELDENFKKVTKYCTMLEDKLKQYPNVVINHNHFCIPHILNISVMHTKPETMLHALEEKDIYISTQSACSSGTTISRAVLELSKKEDVASHSIRISLSGFTKEEELQEFLIQFDTCYHQLDLERNS